MRKRTFQRVRGIVGVGCRRTLARTVAADSARIRLSIIGVAIAIATLLVVTGLGVGLATDTTVSGSNVDYWITPESGGGSTLVNTGGSSLGEVHTARTRLTTIDGVSSATPVLARPLRVQANGSQEYVLVVGVIPTADAPDVIGLSPTALRPGDPYYANGTYNGTWTGELVASPAARSVLNVSTGDAIVPSTSNRSFTVTHIDNGTTGAFAEIPVVLVHLSELQTVTGADEHDQADQMQVAVTDASVENDLEAVYPEAMVETRSELLTRQVFDEDLPLAITVTGLIVAIVTGALFVCTTMGMEVVSDRKQLATMAAIGLGQWSRLLLVGVQTMTTTLLGGIVGTALGGAGIGLINVVGARAFNIEGIAVFQPIFLAYGIAVAMIIGICSLPYLLVLVRRIDPIGGTRR